MRNKGTVWGLAALAVLLAGCAGLEQTRKEDDGAVPPAIHEEAETGFNRRNYTLPQGLRFVPSAMPVLTIAPGVGQITGERRDPAAALPEAEQRRLTRSFRAAYIDGLFRELPLAGVLGGDMVHGWPVKTPLSWAQNWRNASPPSAANSWGIPSLILALSGVGGGETFIIHGPILDAYGRSGGLGGANGAAGYGAPRSNPYSWEGGVAQVFDHGVIMISREGRFSFVPRETETEAEEGALEAENLEKAAYTIPPGIPGLGEQEEQAFLAAWRGETERRQAPLKADAPPFYVDWNDALWLLTGEGEPVGIKGVYLQYFDNARTVFVALAPVVSGLPFMVKVIRPPFLDALLAESRVPGAEQVSPMGPIPAEYRRGFTGALLEGFACYGLPLTDAMPWPGNDSWKESQRFSRGWIAEDE